MDIYREKILEHWENPQNFGELESADMVINQINPLCGDRVTFYFKIKNGKIDKASFTGSGCAISIACTSILSGFIKGKTTVAISKITGEDIFALIGGPIAPARLKCAFLPLEAIKKLKYDLPPTI